MNYNSHPCPQCSAQMAPVLYGWPTTDMIDLARQDVIALGGPNETKESPTHYCYSCGDDFVVIGD